jgi:hypothetical protein
MRTAVAEAQIYGLTLRQRHEGDRFDSTLERQCGYTFLCDFYARDLLCEER